MGDGSGFEVLSGWLAVDVWCLVADLEFGAADDNEEPIHAQKGFLEICV